ncbi:MAG: Serine/threonine-protein phosphatase 2A 65 kDa regulatory subunit A beta isoform, partial [Olpidium bornovanus]
VSEHFLPIFLQLLKDEFLEVRLNVISKLQLVNEAIGSEILSKTLYPAIIELVEDKQWRVRQAVIEYIPLLATQLGTSFFDDKVVSLCIAWLSDSVYAVREAATVNLRKLADVFGPEWAKIDVIPKVLPMATHPNYLYRMTMIFALTSLSSVVGMDDMREQIIATLAKMSADSIPNIRFNVAKAIETLLPVLQATLQPAATTQLLEHTLRPALTKLCEDPDNDVRYFGRCASVKGRCLVPHTLLFFSFTSSAVSGDLRSKKEGERDV